MIARSCRASTVCEHAHGSWQPCMICNDAVHAIHNSIDIEE